MELRCRKMQELILIINSILWFVFYLILLSAFVGWYIECSLPSSEQPNTCPFLCHAKPIHYNSTRQNLIYSKVSTRSPLFSSPMRATLPIYTILDLIKLIIQDKKHTSWSSKLCNFIHLPVTFLQCKPKYLPVKPIFKSTQPMFFPERHRPRFIPIRNNTQNYNSVHCNLH